MKPRIARQVVTVPPRQRDGMSPAHLDNVRALPCIGCGRDQRCHPHHLMRSVPVGERGMKRKAADRYAVPLCPPCHRAAHDDGDDERWLIGRGVDGRSIADALWREREAPDGMRRIIERSLLARGIHA